MMIDPWERRELRRIEQGMACDDPRFAHGLGAGSPHAPREYRTRRRIVIVAAIATMLAAAGISLAFASTVGLILVAAAIPMILAVFTAISPNR